MYKTSFAGFHPVRIEPIHEGGLISCAKLDGCIAEFVRIFAVPKTDGGSREKQCGDICFKVLQSAPKQILGTFQEFFGYSKDLELFVVPCPSALAGNKVCWQLREVTIVLLHPFLEIHVGLHDRLVERLYWDRSGSVPSALLLISTLDV